MNHSALAPLINPENKPPEEPYLRVRLDRQNGAILSMRYLQEVLVVPVQRLTPMPNVPSCMLGLLNRRSRVLWAIDLARLLQLSSSGMPLQQYNIIVVQVGSRRMGLVVQKIEGIVRLSSDRIQSPIGNISPALVPYVRGCMLDQAIWLLLDVPAIAHSPVFHSY
jgi:positive phototaxis protein PixI